MKIIKLFHRYGIRAFVMLFELWFKDTVRVPFGDRIFYQHVDKSTLYHIIHSYPKVQALVDALPPDLSGVAIDGGANNGLFSFLLRQRYGKVASIAIEPNWRVLPWLKKNHQGLTIDGTLSVNMGQVDFFIDKDSDQVGSLKKLNVDKPTDSDSVWAYTLDSILPADHPTTIIKLDLQGGEHHALLGALKTLPNTDFLILEVYMKAPGALEAVRIATNFFPHWKAINSVPYGADVIFYLSF